MTRDEFLKNQWPAYPYWLKPDDSWVCGKITAVHDTTVTMGAVDYQIGEADCHPELGPSVPMKLARPGDCVALQKGTGDSWRGPFLLSPNMLENKAPEGRQWQIFLEVVRQFFISRGFRHWFTPYLVASSGVDAHIDFMTVQGVRTGRGYALPTSPEFELKKALAAGEEKIFEIKSCFRDDDESPVHRPEFTMLEWYRAYENKWLLVKDFDDLVASLAPLFPGVEVAPTESHSIADLFKKYIGLDLTPQTNLTDLQGALRSRNMHYTSNDDWDDLFFRLYVELVEPQLGHQRPIAIYDFPASQSSLARRTPQGWADRFEIYWRGVELANAYQEQNNPYLVADLVKREIEKRRRLNRIPPSDDKAFLAAMEAGFPPSAGAALGLDRLYMVLRGARSLQ